MKVNVDSWLKLMCPRVLQINTTNSGRINFIKRKLLYAKINVGYVDIINNDMMVLSSNYLSLYKK